jgi:hypothetical protein
LSEKPLGAVPGTSAVSFLSKAAQNSAGRWPMPVPIDHAGEDIGVLSCDPLQNYAWSIPAPRLLQPKAFPMTTPAPDTAASDSASTPKAKAPKKPAARKRRPGSVAKKGPKPAAKGVSKSDEVRRLAAATKAKGENPRPSVIVATLAKRGIDVAAAQVSIVLKKMGFRPLRKTRKQAARGRAAAGTPNPGAQRTSAADSISVEDLIAAKKAVASLGGSERAVEAIQALKRLEG